jgi:hypothetical protein
VADPIVIALREVLLDEAEKKKGLELFIPQPFLDGLVEDGYQKSQRERADEVGKLKEAHEKAKSDAVDQAFKSGMATGRERGEAKGREAANIEWQPRREEWQNTLKQEEDASRNSQRFAVFGWILAILLALIWAFSAPKPEAAKPVSAAGIGAVGAGLSVMGYGLSGGPQ